MKHTCYSLLSFWYPLLMSKYSYSCINMLGILLWYHIRYRVCVWIASWFCFFIIASWFSQKYGSCSGRLTRTMIRRCRRRSWGGPCGSWGWMSPTRTSQTPWRYSTKMVMRSTFVGTWSHLWFLGIGNKVNLLRHLLSPLVYGVGSGLRDL